MNILILEPYFTGSHRAWAQGYQKQSKHTVEILSLSGNFWKWRMHGGAVSLAQNFLATDFEPDLLLATDMLDLTTFLSLTRHKTSRIPTAIYFHENQLSYPWSPADRDVMQKRDKHYGFINYVSALTADVVFFNSKYHQDSFLDELQRYLKHFPDHIDLENIDRIKSTSKVLPLGLDLSRLDKLKPALNPKLETGHAKPLILWNHRWEYDKNAGEFFKALFLMAEKGLDFEIAILGEAFSEKPEEFRLAKEKLGSRIIQFGYANEFSEYAHWLWRADILPVTSNQDFFGASVVEAIYCDCLPILPARLVYPELVPAELHDNYLYRNFDDLVTRLEQAIYDFDALPSQSLRDIVKKFNWASLVSDYDDEMESFC